MTDNRNRVPGWYWAVAGAAFIWGGIACAGYVAGVTMTEADVAKLPPVQAEAWRSYPSWLIGTYAVAVWTCLGGAIGLLLRQAWARPLYVVSLIAAVIQFSYSLATTRVLEVDGPSAMVGGATSSRSAPRRASWRGRSGPGRTAPAASRSAARQYRDAGSTVSSCCG